MCDRLSFTRFLGIVLEDRIPDGTTLWLFREKLAKAALIDKLFAGFGQHLEAKGYIARGGQMIDATIVAVPRSRNTQRENEAVKAGKTPEEWEKQPQKLAQKDRDARRAPHASGMTDEEAWQKFLRLQEPRQRRRQAQVDPALRRD